MMKLNYFLLSLLTSSALFASQEGLERLMQGNQRYVNDALKHPNRTVYRRLAVASRQKPFAVIVGCSDSRVSPEIIFDQGIGDLFVVRVAGNVIGPLQLESIEFAVDHLNSSVILVLGHENCGAVNAVIQGTTKEIKNIAALIEPAVQEEKKKNPSNLLEASIKANAINMKNNLLNTPLIKKLVADKKLDVQAGYFNLQTGVVELLND